MMGHAIHGGAAIHPPKELSLAMVWTHLGSFVPRAIVSDFVNFSTCMFVHVFGARMCLIK